LPPIFYTEPACLQQNGQLFAFAIAGRDDRSDCYKKDSAAPAPAAIAEFLSTRLQTADKNEPVPPQKEQRIRITANPN
jgi:hypothetical protein